MHGESGMIVEFVLAMLLLLGFLVFAIIFGRAFSERSRMLAANRTVAWMYTHADPDDKINGLQGFQRMAENGELADLLAEWHFQTGTRAEGVVVVGEDNVENGVFIEKPDGSRVDLSPTLKSIAQEGLDNRTVESRSSEERLGGTTVEAEGVDRMDLGATVAGMTMSLMGGFVKFLSRDFEHYHAHIGYGMPVMFPRRTLAVFWGDDMVQDLDSLGGLGRSTSSTGEPGQVYAFIKPSWSGGCVMPMLDAGNGGGALQDIAENLQAVMSTAEQTSDAADQTPDRYRPYMHTDDGGKIQGYFIEAGQEPKLNVEAMKALLVFEKEHFGPSAAPAGAGTASYVPLSNSEAADAAADDADPRLEPFVGADGEPLWRTEDEQTALLHMLDQDPGLTPEGLAHAQDMAMLANATYLKDPDKPELGLHDTVPPGYVRVSDEDLQELGLTRDDFEDEDSGFYADLYYDERNDTYTLAFRGTELPTLRDLLRLAFRGRIPPTLQVLLKEDDSSLGDLSADLEQAVGLSTPQYEAAVSLAHELQHCLGDRFVHITGHSLGGGLAATASMTTGVRATTFNAAGLHENTVDSFAKFGVDQITNYRVQGEILTYLQEEEPPISVPRSLVPVPQVLPRWPWSSHEVSVPLPDAVGRQLTIDALDSDGRSRSGREGVGESFARHGMDCVMRGMMIDDERGAPE